MSTRSQAPAPTPATAPASGEAGRSPGRAPGTRPSAGRPARWQGPAAAAAFLALLVGGWHTMALALDSVLVPGVDRIGAEILLLVSDPLFYSELGVTFQRVALGFALAFVAALFVGIAMGRSPLARRFFEPAVLIGLTVPGLVWALLCVIWFGVALINPVTAVALSSAPALTLSIYQGTRATDAQLLEMAHVYRFSAYDRLRHLWLPSLAPALFGGARLGLSLAWKVIVLVEIFGMSDGVGASINGEFAAQNVAGVLAWTVLFAVVMALLEYGVLQALENRAGRWRKVASV
ncbi:ABC transporter permease [Nocardiopsis sp. HUAS JQ3]|uniref:ABC transporter permease n=1 Tax=Nocardiopsis sp. HUAS JQ3 TaxID=3061629 RepID=UPI0023A9BE45|nr:ABC transporter permease subunit [Nocardiopsis sp. HUAS JQ3]WDZ92768.1 ABC transporter permease subunit [Nocardiopsis sp. HUAS JQ3]